MNQALQILLFDKSTSDIDRLVHLLKENNLDVSLMHNVQEAYQFCLSSRPDLIIFDINAAGNDGDDFFQKIKNQYSTHQIPLLLTTQESDYTKRIELMDMGVDDFITKPYYPEEVVARVMMLFQEFKPAAPVSKNVERGFVGSLKEMNLIDLIQTMELGKKSGIINLNRGDKEGQIYVNQGKIVDAVVKDYDSVERAYLHMLTWIEGSFYVLFQNIEQNSPLTDDNQTLFREGAKIIDQWRRVIGELPSLHTYLIAVSNENSQSLPYPERTMLTHFQEPQTILQAIDHSDFEDFDGLKIIKSLLEKGLLIKTDNRPANTGVRQLALRPTFRNKRDAKSKYSHIFAIFQRNKKRDQGSTDDLSVAAKSDVANDARPVDHTRIKNKIQLTKAELLLIRQKLGK